MGQIITSLALASLCLCACLSVCLSSLLRSQFWIEFDETLRMLMIRSWVYVLCNRCDTASTAARLEHCITDIGRVSRNTAPRSPRTPRAPRWNIVKTSRRWCLGFNWISRKISRKRRISEGGNWRRGETSSYPPCTYTRSAVCAVYAVRCFATSLFSIMFLALICRRFLARGLCTRTAVVHLP